MLTLYLDVLKKGHPECVVIMDLPASFSSPSFSLLNFSAKFIIQIFLSNGVSRNWCLALWRQRDSLGKVVTFAIMLLKILDVCVDFGRGSRIAYVRKVSKRILVF